MINSILKEIRKSMIINSKKWYLEPLLYILFIPVCVCFVTAISRHTIVCIISWIVSVLVDVVVSIIVANRTYDFAGKIEGLEKYLIDNNYYNSSFINWIINAIDRNIEDIKDNHSRIIECVKWTMSIIVLPAIAAVCLCYKSLISEELVTPIVEIILCIYFIAFVIFLALVLLLYDYKESKVSDLKEIREALLFVNSLKVEKSNGERCIKNQSNSSYK